jgi:L-alanine-DL-glutamate epimerase-like enolase superfamily enzyme
MRTLSAYIEDWAFLAPIRITGHTFTSIKVLVVEIADGAVLGKGEASGVYYLGDTPENAMQQAHALTVDIRNGMDRTALLKALPAGGARNAIDCALWDLECRLSGQSIWDRTAISPTQRLTVQTIGIQDEPDDVARLARTLTDAPMLKLKLDGDRPIERVRAVRAARPDARLVVDANQGFSFSQLQDCLPEFARMGVELIEQPLPVGHDEALEGLSPPIPICADESCQDRSDLTTVAKRYQAINIKLDKTGGLTEALLLARAAKAAGLKLMVGNMSGTSLAAAPAFVIAQLCDFIDLDGPYSLVNDRTQRLVYRGSIVSEPSPRFWG